MVNTATWEKGKEGGRERKKEGGLGHRSEGGREGGHGPPSAGVMVAATMPVLLFRPRFFSQRTPEGREGGREGGRAGV